MVVSRWTGGGSQAEDAREKALNKRLMGTANVRHAATEHWGLWDVATRGQLGMRQETGYTLFSLHPRRSVNPINPVRA